jgi:hypothetical protein
VVREGRQIFMQTTDDAEQHERFVREFLAQRPHIEARRDEYLARLRDILAEVDPGACVAYASLTYLQKDPDTYRESEDDQSPAHVEFLALQALPVLGETRSASSPAILAERGDEALHLVREAFNATLKLTVLRGIDALQRPGASTSFEEYRSHAIGEALVVRGSGYAEHIRAILDGCFEGFESDCTKHLGFTAAEAWRLVEAIQQVIGKRIAARLGPAQEKYAALSKELKRARRKGHLPAEWAGIPPSQQRNMLQRAIFVEIFGQPIELALLTADALSEVSGVQVEHAEAWLDTFHCPPGEYNATHHGAPFGGHPITRLPLLKVENGYLAPAPTSLSESLRPRMEDALRERAPAVWARYDAHRGRWLEKTATERLRSALPGAKAWTGIPWQGVNDSSDLDGLVHCDDLALRLQCKAGRVSEAARRGAPSMVEDITAVVSDAAHQHARLTAALIDASPEALGFDEDQTAALRTPMTFEVVVCLDDVTVWSTETHKLRHLVALPETDQVPWVLSLADLMAVTDLLDGAQLVHFLTRRQRLEREGRVSAHDELDWVGNYIHDGLYFDVYFDQPSPPDVFRLLSYTEPIDAWYFARAGLIRASIPKPRQPLPDTVEALIRRLERDRPTHWLTAAILILNGDDESRTLIGRFMTHTIERANAAGSSNASQVFAEYGFTLWVDRSLSSPDFQRLMQAFAERKIAETQRPNWVVLGLASDGKLTVVVCETQAGVTLAHVLLQRLPRSHGA